MTILHIFPDEKFFDDVSNSFDKIEGIRNLYVYYSPDPNYQFKYIKLHQKIIIETDKKKYLKLFSDKNIDVLFFHSLSKYYYNFITHADDIKVIIWWSWGYDLYQTNIINIELYKPLTKSYLNTRNRELILNSKINSSLLKNILQKIKMQIASHFNTIIRPKVLSRIDYFVPVLPIEYELISQSRFFKAKRFMERSNFSDFDESRVSNETPKSYGNILLGNSSTYTNNHLDIIENLQNIDIHNRNIIIPLSYGDKEYANIVKSKIDDKYVVLDKFIEYSEYDKLISSCSYAIYGAIRQQSMGNIYLCLLKGIKIFLYKDSLIYKQLEKDGYIVFTIDNDLSEKELSLPLSHDEMLHNQQISRTIRERSGLSGLKKSLNQIIKQTHKVSP